MSSLSPAPSQPRLGRWLALAGTLALGVFTVLTVRDAGRPAVRPAAGGTFTGRDVDGRLVQICLFEQDGDWQGWLYREGREQTEWFSTTNRAHPWQTVVNVRDREEVPKPPEPIVTSTDDALRLNATLPRTNGWASDTANLTRQFEHLKFRQLTGLRLGPWGGTKEFIAQFPKLSGGSVFHAAITREIVHQCETAAAEFTSDPIEFWRENLSLRQPMVMNAHELTAHWQLRLLTTNVASFCVWSHDEVGGNGNHSHWRGENFVWEAEGIRPLRLVDLLGRRSDWPVELRQRCAQKLQGIGAPDYAQGAVTEETSAPAVFSLSPTGLQIYFNPYEIASGADGEFVVHFDYAELKDLLRSDGPATFLPRAP